MVVYCSIDFVAKYNKQGEYAKNEQDGEIKVC